MSDDVLKFRINGRRSLSGHMQQSREVDLRHLRDGRCTKGNLPGHTGRPVLACQLVGANKKDLQHRSHSIATRFIRAISYLWRALDTIERASPSAEKLDDVRKIDGPTWIAFTDQLAEDDNVKTNRYIIYSDCKLAVTRACSKLNYEISLPSSPFDSVPPNKRRSASVPYTRNQEIEIVRAFRAERHRVESRIRSSCNDADRSDASPDKVVEQALLSQRRDRLPASGNGDLSDENIKNFVRSELLINLPNSRQFRERYKFDPRVIGIPPDASSLKLNEGEIDLVQRRRGEGFGLTALYRSFLPTRFDLVPFVCELVHLTDGNLQTLLDIDRSDWFRTYGSETDVTIMSRKARARGAPNFWDSKKGGRDEIFDIIESAIRITEPLHARVLARLEELERSPQTAASVAEMDRLRPMKRRVWIAMSGRSIQPAALGQQGFHEVANEILRRAKLTENGKPLQWHAWRVRYLAAEEEAFKTRFSPKSLQRKLQHASATPSIGYTEQPRAFVRQIETVVKRLSDLMDDPLQRGACWPKRAPTENERPHQPQTTVLVMPGGRQWAIENFSIDVMADPAHAEVRS